MPESHEAASRRPVPDSVSQPIEILERSAHLGIYLKDTENRILWVNNDFARMFGFKPKDFIGKRVDEVISDPEILATLRRDDNFIYTAGKPHSNRILHWLGNPKNHFRLDRFPFMNKSGELAGIIGLVVEIDEALPLAETLKEELAAASQKLRETETALRVVTECRQQDLSLPQEQLGARLRDQVQPHLEHFKRTRPTPKQAELVELIETNLKNFYDPAYARLSSPSCMLSPTELKVAQLIRDGKTNKEIAKLLHLSKSTILTHRHHIRAKLGIKNQKVNLRTLLNS
jgi:PAS domain S-box-containing protein